MFEKKNDWSVSLHASSLYTVLYDACIFGRYDKYKEWDRSLPALYGKGQGDLPELNSSYAAVTWLSNAIKSDFDGKLSRLLAQVSDSEGV